MASEPSAPGAAIQCHQRPGPVVQGAVTKSGLVAFNAGVGDGLDGETVEDFVVRAEDKWATGEADSGCIGAAADYIGSILEDFVEGFFGDVEAEPRMSLQPGAALQRFRPTRAPGWI